jgi:putative flippase GtrA
MAPAPVRDFRRTGSPRFVRYVGVGAICAVLNNIFLIAIVGTGFGYLPGLMIICLPMLVIGFALHTILTFEVKPTASAFLRYSLAMLANYPMWIAGLFMLCDVMKLPIFIASPVGTLFLFFWNYVSTHWAIARSTCFKSIWRRSAGNLDSR